MGLWGRKEQPADFGLAPHVKLVDARHGRFFVLDTDLYVSRSLQVYGEWTEAEIRLLSPMLRPGDCVADIGANLGSHTVPFARTVGDDGRVIAFEPQPRIFQLLASNVTINGLANVQLYQAACAAAPGMLKLPHIDYATPGNFGGARIRSLEAQGQAAGSSVHYVPVVRLDDVFDGDRLNLVKVDVEGMEKDVLTGAARTLGRFRPLLYVENESPQDSRGLLQALQDLDYVAYWHVITLFDPENFRRYPSDVFSGPGAPTGCVNNLCVPREAGIDVRGLPRVQAVTEHPRL